MNFYFFALKIKTRSRNSLLCVHEGIISRMWMGRDDRFRLESAAGLI